MVGEKRLARLFDDSLVVWLATTCPDGSPHVVPCWFAWDGDRLLIPTRARARKVRNIAIQPRVMIALGTTEPFFAAELVQATASTVDVDDAFRGRIVAKYRDHLSGAGFTVASFWERFTACLVVTPRRELDWGAREAARRAPAPAFA